MTATTSTRSTRGATPPAARAATYGRHISGVLVATFTLSVVHTVYAWVEGIEDPTFTVTTPLAWGFYAVAFAMAALARRDGRGAQLGVLTFLAVVLAIAVFYYPTTFGPEQQTVFGWFENDVYIGLLVVAAYLGVLRWRGTVLRPA
ncbi:hypothetical protein [Oryzobacter terrae]|uniref:hypothetical protein n=1 Tax=Oryzobacter terrae TaxID=1620385 RepID=UPI00366D764C